MTFPWGSGVMGRGTIRLPFEEYIPPDEPEPEPECEGALVDEETFSRVRSSSDTYGTSEFAGNPVWVRDGPLRALVNIDGDIATMTSGTFPAFVNVQDIQNYNSRSPVEVMFRGRIRPGIATQGSVVISLEEPPAGVGTYYSVAMASHNSDATSQFVNVSAGDGTTDYVVGSGDGVILINTWYTVRALFGEEVIKARWWADGDPDPVTWAIETAIPSTIPAVLDMNNYLEVRLSGGAATDRVDLDYIRFYETCEV